jgi:hypothetical protein
MRFPGLAALLFAFTFPAFALAQRYELPKWEECSDPQLAEAFEKLTGGKIWKVQWITGAYAQKPDDPPAIHINSAWVLGKPKSTGNRIQEGVIEHFYRGAVGDPKKGWWPGEPFQWLSGRKADPPAPNCPTRYVLAKPPSGLEKDTGELAGRIYGVPIFSDSAISAGEALKLIDATFQLGMTALHASESVPGSEMWDGEKHPDFASLASLETQGPLFQGLGLPEPAPDRRMVGLSQGGNGAILLFFRQKDGAFQFEQTAGVDY